MVKSERAWRPSRGRSRRTSTLVEEPTRRAHRADRRRSTPTPTAAEADGDLWDPVPVTLPTYVAKPAARRTVRTIDLDATGVWTSGRTEADSATRPRGRAPPTSVRRRTPARRARRPRPSAPEPVVGRRRPRLDDGRLPRLRPPAPSRSRSSERSTSSSCEPLPDDVLPPLRRRSPRSVRCVDQTGDVWGTVGQSRTILLADGGTMTETLTGRRPPDVVRLRASPRCTAPCSRLWSPPSTASGASRRPAPAPAITWSWVLAARPPRASLALPLLARMWRGYARQALEQLERSWSDSGRFGAAAWPGASLSLRVVRRVSGLWRSW